MLDADQIAATVHLLLGISLVLFVALFIRERGNKLTIKATSAAERKLLASEIEGLKKRFSGILDLDKEFEALKEQIGSYINDIEQLRASYKEKKIIYDRLAKEVALFDENLAFAEMGVYQPHFDFNDSEEYKKNIELARNKQKVMIGNKSAVFCNTKWEINGNAAQGLVMTNRNIKLTLRAFNNECEAAISNTRWNNVNAMEKRISNAFNQINKLNESNHIFISMEYFNLKLKELFLTHEYREKIKYEREERAEVARNQREEQKLIRDIEKAEEEEARYQKLLAKAKKEAESVAGPKLDFLINISKFWKVILQRHTKN